jgi:hypothetical protein
VIAAGEWQRLLLGDLRLGGGEHCVALTVAVLVVADARERVLVGLALPPRVIVKRRDRRRPARRETRRAQSRFGLSTRDASHTPKPEA